MAHPKKEEQKKSALTPPTPIKRPRSLTLPLNSTQSPITPKSWFKSPPKPQVTHHQTTSPLFTKLPAELRALIYTFVICGKERGTIHIGFRGSPVASMNASNKPGYVAAYRDTALGKRVWGLDRGVLALMRSCRLVYTEAIPLLYSIPTFVFSHTGPLTFMAFVAGVVLERKNVIRWLDLGDLESARPGDRGEKEGDGDVEFSYAFVRHLDMYTELPDARREGRKLTEGWAVGKVLGGMKGLGRGRVEGWVRGGGEEEEGKKVLTRRNGI